MAQTVRTSVDANGAVTSAILLIRPQNPCLVAFAVIDVVGVISATVQMTIDPLETAAQQAAAVWFDHPFVAAVAVNTNGNVSLPITGLRLVNGAAGLARLTAIQMI